MSIDIYSTCTECRAELDDNKCPYECAQLQRVKTMKKIKGRPHYYKQNGKTYYMKKVTLPNGLVKYIYAKNSNEWDIKYQNAIAEIEATATAKIKYSKIKNV